MISWHGQTTSQGRRRGLNLAPRAGILPPQGCILTSRPLVQGRRTPELGITPYHPPPPPMPTGGCPTSKKVLSSATAAIQRVWHVYRLIYKPPVSWVRLCPPQSFNRTRSVPTTPTWPLRPYHQHHRSYWRCSDLYQRYYLNPYPLGVQVDQRRHHGHRRHRQRVVSTPRPISHHYGIWYVATPPKPLCRRPPLPS